MWPWKQRGPAADEVRSLRHSIEDLQREMRGLKAEWLEMYEKLTRRDDRARKRLERENDPIPAITTPQEAKAALRARWAATRGTTNGS